MASLRFHKVSSLPTSGYTVGDVYYVVGQGIYVATSTTSCTKFAYANDAAADTKGVLSLNTVKGTKVNNAAAADSADSATTATNYTGGSVSIASKFTSVDSSINTINTSIGKINAVVSGNTLTITKPDGSTVTFTDTDTNTHNSHKVTFSNGAASNSTGTSVAVVKTVNDSDESLTSMTASTTRVNVPTLEVTNGLASRITSLETKATTGMQYKGTRTDGTVPATSKVGDVYKVTTKAISEVGAEVGDFIVCNKATTSATTSAWDVWQANVNKDAYWDINMPVDGQIIIADGTDGKIKSSSANINSFAAASHKHASSAINAMTGYSKPASASAIAVGDTLNAAIGKLEYKVDATQTSLSNHTGNTDNPHKVTKAQVGLSNVTNNRQVVGLSTGTTAGHFVTWGANGYTVADSGLNSDSFDAKGTASGLITTLRGGYTDTLQSVAKAAAAAQTTAEAREPKTTAVRHDASTAVGSATQPVYVASNGAATACTYTLGKSVPSDAVFTDTHHTYAFTITNGTATATSFTQNAAANLAIKASASGGLTASTSAGSGTLTVNVGVGSGYTIPLDTQITAWNKKWDPVNATTSSKGIASFNSNNFSVSDGAVSLKWATWPE